MRPRPTYEELDWSPPSSPKPGHRRQSSQSATHSLKRRLRQIRPFIAPFLIVVAIVYIFSRYRYRYVRPKHQPSVRWKNVDWRVYAYSLYATSTVELCNCLMIFDQLDKLGSRASRLLYYPEEWDTDVENEEDRDSWLLAQAEALYDVRLKPLPVKATGKKKQKADGEVLIRTTFLPFNQTQYLRIIHLNHDVSLLQHLDDLFVMPPSTVAMTRNYTSHVTNRELSRSVLLIEPSEQEARRIGSSAYATIEYTPTEMLNQLYANSAMILPHRKYGLLTSEFRRTEHGAFFGNDYEEWDPRRAMRETSVLIFSDWPLPKPWIMWPSELLVKMMPPCAQNAGSAAESGCENQKIWMELYNDYRRRRKDVCLMLSIPAPQNFEQPPDAESKPG